MAKTTASKNADVVSKVEELFGSDSEDEQVTTKVTEDSESSDSDSEDVPVKPVAKAVPKNKKTAKKEPVVDSDSDSESVAKPTENKKTTKKSEEKSTEKSTCQFVLTRGDRKGQKCGKGCKGEYCSVHAKSSKENKTEKPVQNDAEPEEHHQLSESMSKMAIALSKKFKLNIDEVSKFMDAYLLETEGVKTNISEASYDSEVAEKSTPAKGTCGHTFTRGDRNGEVCGKNVRGGSDRCGAHSKGKSSSESSDSHEADKPAPEVPKKAPVSKIKVVKKDSHWVIDGTVIAVKNSKNHTVIGYIKKDGELSPKLTPAQKKKVAELGLSE